MTEHTVENNNKKKISYVCSYVLAPRPIWRFMIRCSIQYHVLSISKNTFNGAKFSFHHSLEIYASCNIVLMSNNENVLTSNPDANQTGC
jgi:hypothetical protein